MSRHDLLLAKGYIFEYAKMMYYRNRSDCCDAPVSYKLQGDKPFNKLNVNQKLSAKFAPTCDSCNKLCSIIYKFIHPGYNSNHNKAVEVAHV